MAIHRRTGAWAFGLVFTGVVTLGSLPLFAQESKSDKGDETTKSPAAKRAVDPTRRVPDFFGQIGLTPEQKEDIYKIRAKHQQKIEALQKQIIELQSQIIAESEALLNDTQKQLLAYRRESSTRSKKAKTTTASPAPVTSPSAKTGEKPGE